MDPAKLAKTGSEHAHQKAYFQWLLTWSREVHAMTFAIPNGGARGNDRRTAMIRGAALKNEGVKRGVPDVMCAWPMFIYATRLQYNGMFIEMKKVIGGTVADEQSEWRVKLEQRGYFVATCYNWHEAANATAKYFAQPYPFPTANDGA